MSRAKLLLAVGIVLCVLSVAVGLARLRAPEPTERTSAQPAAAPHPAAPMPPPANPDEQAAPPGAPPAGAKAPAPEPPRAPPDPSAALLAELNAALPGLGVKPPAQLTAAVTRGDHLTLTFSHEFQPYLASLSALDELTAALSGRVHGHGYRHLDLLMLDTHGQAVSIDELVKTPPAQRPRPEPIDDGVRR